MPFDGNVPQDGTVYKPLDHMTGKYRPKDICIRRSTYLLLNSLTGIGDYGQQHDAVQPGFLAWECFTLSKARAQLEFDLKLPET